MLHSIYDICSSVKHKGTIEVSENLILGHMWNSQLRKKDKEIKSALFEYLNSVDRNHISNSLYSAHRDEAPGPYLCVTFGINHRVMIQEVPHL